MKLRYLTGYVVICFILSFPSIGLSYTAVEYFHKGNINFNQKKFNDAIVNFSKAIELNPTFYEAYYNLGNIYEIHNKHKAAIKNFHKVIEIKPDYYQAYNNRGSAYKNLGKNNEALLDFNKAIELKPDLYQALKNRGSLYRGQGKLNLAIQDFNQAIRLNSTYFQAYFNRGITYKQQDKYDLAIQDFNKTIELRRKHIPALIELSYIYATCKDASFRDGEKAVTILLKAISYKETVPAMNALATAYVVTKQHEKAIATYKNIFEKDNGTIKDYQQSLKDQGYYTGLIDGSFSINFEKSLQSFVRDGNHFQGITKN